MTTSARVVLLVWVTAFLSSVVSGLVVLRLRAAQEKPARETRQWNITTVNGTVVAVIDTEGVCLYVAVPSWSRDLSPTIAAVPKTQLPKGTGCQ